MSQKLFTEDNIALSTNRFRRILVKSLNGNLYTFGHLC